MDYPFNDCTLCPRGCHADRTAGAGLCGETEELSVSRAAPHAWEEPCLSGENGSGTVFFSGCSLRCVYCQNHEISRGHKGSRISPARLAQIFLSLQEQKVHNINLVTPTHFVPQIASALTAAKERGLTLPVVYNTGGYEKTDTLRMIEPLVDIYLPDFKYLSGRLSGKYSFAEDYFKYAAASLRYMAAKIGAPVFGADGMMQRGVIVRHLVLPGYSGHSMRVLRYLFERYQNSIFYSIMNQYTPVRVERYPELNRRVIGEEYDRVVDFALSLGIENGFIQQGETARESFIPAFGREGIIES